MMRSLCSRTMWKKFLMRIGTLFGTFLPPFAVKIIAGILSTIAFLLIKGQRKRIEKNLSYITGQVATRRLALETFQNLGITVAHFLQSPALRDKILSYCEFDIAPLISAVKKGKAVILFTAHFGNWELAGIALRKLGLPLAVIAEPLGNGLFETYNYYRSRFGVEVIPYDQPRRILRAIKEKRVIAFLADRSLAGGGIPCPFFSKVRLFPRGPAYFSIRYELPILPGYIILQKNCRKTYYIRVEEEINFHRSGDFENDVVLLTKSIAKRIEDWVRNYPSQWFVFEAEWQEC